MQEYDKSSKWLIQLHGDSILRLAGIGGIQEGQILGDFEKFFAAGGLKAADAIEERAAHAESVEREEQGTDESAGG